LTHASPIGHVPLHCGVAAAPQGGDVVLVVDVVLVGEDDTIWAGTQRSDVR
jgi:hypothetical protein